MSDEIPSPASHRTGMPWESALYDAVGRLEARAVEAERENERLIVRVHRLEHALRECRTRLENWKLRQEAWRRERGELLARIRDFSN